MKLQKCLMLGAGHSLLQRKLMALTSAPESDTEWVSLDMNPDCHPDVVFDLDDIEKGVRLPFDDATFDELHAYEVLEHYGHQGDYLGYFRGMRELWRILRVDGLLIGTCPSWNVQWTWGDPGHRRVISEGTLSYLTKEMYEERGKNFSPATDYGRFVKPCWWKQKYFNHDPKSGGMAFAMEKVVIP